MPGRAPILAAASAALALAGCGGSSTSGSSGRPATSTGGKSALAPPASAHPATRAQSAETVCRAFSYRLAVGPLHKGINQLVPGDGRVLYAELEGLSRRIEFTPAAPARHAGLYRLAAALDRAAVMAQALPAAPTRSAFAHSVARLRGQLEEASALAARLALPNCRIALGR
jgi:hypothetical protein